MTAAAAGTCRPWLQRRTQCKLWTLASDGSCRVAASGPATARQHLLRRLACAQLGEDTAPSTSTARQARPSPPPRPALSRALGVDYGRRLIGLAVSTLGLAPRPLPPIPGGRAGDVPELAKQVIEKARSEGCYGIVIGLPVTQRGSLRRPHTDSQQGRRCRNFALNVAALAESARLDVFLVDEAGTTAEAHEYMYSSGTSRASTTKMKDSVAAALILGKYFDNPGAAMFVKPAQWRQGAAQ